MRFELTEYIAIQVTDHSKAARFYQDVLGMELKEEKEGETVLRCGSHTLYVESNPKNHTFFDFKVDDIEAAKSRLLDEGCRITKVYNDKSVMVEDPFGMRFHLWQEQRT